MKQEYKALFVEELLREENVFNVDYFIPGDKGNLRVYRNTKDFTTFLKPARLGYNNSGRIYSVIPLNRVAKYLECNLNKLWDYYFTQK